MIAFAGDDEPSANSYFASAAAALSNVVNRFFFKEPKWRVERRTKEGTRSFGLIFWPYAPRRMFCRNARSLVMAPPLTPWSAPEQLPPSYFCAPHEFADG
jgi:hypothetical protein